MEDCCQRLVKCEADMSMQIAMLKRDFEDLKENVMRSETVIVTSLDNQAKSIEGLVEAWNNGTGFIKFIKWSAPIIVTCISVYHIVKEFFKS